MWLRSIRTAFSTLFILLYDWPARAAGVHDARVDTTSWTRFERSLIRFDQLFRMAERRSTFLRNRSVSIPAHARPRQMAITHGFVNSVVTTASMSLPASASSCATGMNGWSAGHMDKLGSFLFCC